MKKYKLLKDDFIEYKGLILYRIEALKDWWNIKEGQLGGYIWKEENLSQLGTCWVIWDQFDLLKYKINETKMRWVYE